MIALLGVLLLCGVVLFVADFIQGFIVEARTAAVVAGAGIAVCAALIMGFFVVYL